MKILANQPNKNNQSSKYEQGSGSEYHRLHASHVPDYGANSMDPIAESVMNQIDTNEQQ